RCRAAPARERTRQEATAGTRAGTASRSDRPAAGAKTGTTRTGTAPPAPPSSPQGRDALLRFGSPGHSFTHLGDVAVSALTLVVPAAGLGKRLASAYPDGPKCLLPIEGRPILRHVLDAGLQAPVDHIVIIVGRHGPAIAAAIGDCY